MPNQFGVTSPSGEKREAFLARVLSRAAKACATIVLAAAASLPLLLAAPGQAAAETRSLKLYFVHTGEKANITFKRNGKFDPKGLQQLNRFLRDWRRNQPTKMDPRLFDLIWEVYRQSGSNQYINVVSAFRSPQTNSMLRKNTKGVAEKSQHMLGKAMDFYIPGVKLATLRAIGMRMQVGGVGFYPKSGSPFVHMDVGNVRAWPRMSRQELVRLFPDGKTMHIPADGKPLPGYQQAVAEHKRRGGAPIEMAEASPKRRNLFQVLFGGADEQEESGGGDEAPVAAPRPVEQELTNPPGVEPPVMTAAVDPDINAPVPASRPAFNDVPGVAAALVPTDGSAAQEALAAAMPAAPVPPPGDEFADLAAYKVPVPTLLGPRGLAGDAAADPDVLTASAGGPNGPLDAADLSVPVPVARPQVAEALLASTDGAEEADGDEAEQAALSPEMADALDDQGIARLAAQDQRIAAGEDYTTDEPEDVALLDGQPADLDQAFGDGFDAPKASEATLQDGVPVKGSRPGKSDAVAAVRANAQSAKSKLTEKMISDWALSNARIESASAVKAPRFLASALRSQPATAPAGGFSVTAPAVDPGRFSGTVEN